VCVCVCVWMDVYAVGSRGKGERKFPIFAQPKLSISNVIAFSDAVLTSVALNHSTARSTGRGHVVRQHGPCVS